MDHENGIGAAQRKEPNLVYLHIVIVKVKSECGFKIHEFIQT